MLDSILMKISRMGNVQWGLLLSLLLLPLYYHLMVSGYWGWGAMLLAYNALVVIMFTTVNSILDRIRRSAFELSEGNLSERISTRGKAGGPLFRAFNRIGEDMSRTVNFLGMTAHNLTDVAASVQKDSDLSKCGAERQQQAVQDAETIVDRLVETSREVFSFTETASQQANEARVQADAGSAAMANLEQALGEVSEQAQESHQQVSMLVAESETIGQVVDTINSIAEQTNLLALNAAIESARAGDMGRGFAVVADEVRTLAQRTQAATSDIRDKIAGLQEKTDSVASVIEQNQQSVVRSLQIANEAEATFAELNHQIDAIRQVGEQIAGVAQDQTRESENLNASLQAVATVADDNVKATQETLLASITVGNLAGEINSLLHRFAIDQQQISQEDARRSKLITWGPELDIGVAEINRQHQTLVNLINELSYLLDKNYGLASIKRVVQGLIDYTANHFKYEETLFAQFGYQEEQSHVDSHNKLVQQVLAFQRRVESGEDIGPELMQFLKNWVSKHIQQEDIEYAACFRRHGM